MPYPSSQLRRSLQIFSLCLASTASAQTPSDFSADAKAVTEALVRYHGGLPGKSARKLHFAYFLPTDREPAPEFRERLTRVLEETVEFYARQMESYGLKPQRMPLDREADGLLHFVMVKGKEPWTTYNTKAQISGSRIYEECLPVLRAAGIDPEQETIALFTAVMEWDPARQRFRQQSPYQGRGDARSGFCWQIDAPPLDPRRLLDKAAKVDDGEYGILSMGRWNSLFVGGVIHELGHALGLPHNAQRPAQLKELGTSLMGTGNHTFAQERRGEGMGTFLTFADALRLASHPLFTGSDKGLQPAAASTGSFSDLQVQPDGDAIVVTGRVQSSPPAYAVVAYTDGAGGGDYDAITTTALPDAEGRFRLRCDTLPAGKDVALRLTGLQVNGATFSQEELRFSTNQQGVAQIEDLRQQLILAPVLAALRVGRGDEAARLTSALPESETARALAAPMLTSPEQRPASPAAGATTWSLCDLRPQKASVGWRQPAFDYSPEDLFIRVNGKLHRRAVYAHAPSSYTWALDGSWQTLNTRCAVSDGPGGSVVFVVKMDGVEKWRSDVVRPGAIVPCELPLSGVKSLELIVENAGDDFHRDHGYWLDPSLKK